MTETIKRSTWPRCKLPYGHGSMCNPYTKANYEADMILCGRAIMPKETSNETKLTLIFDKNAHSTAEILKAVVTALEPFNSHISLVHMEPAKSNDAMLITHKDTLTEPLHSAHDGGSETH